MKVKVAVPGSLSITVLIVSVNVKEHQKKKIQRLKMSQPVLLFDIKTYECRTVAVGNL